MRSTRRVFIGGAVTAATAAGAVAVGIGAPAGAAAPAGTVGTPPLLRPRRLRPGDTVALINPSNAVYEREPYLRAAENLQGLGFTVREAPNLHARRGQFAGTDAQRASDVNAMFADPEVHGILAMTGGSGGNRMLPLVDYNLIRRHPKFLGGFSDLTALLNAVHQQTGLVTFHCPVATSEWNPYSVAQFKAVAMAPGAEGEAATLRNPVDNGDGLATRNGRTMTLRGGR
ncbi:MAG: LD-carboxypeptidase, partial [Rubrivivax sp.]